jgi:hypothetical protein
VLASVEELLDNAEENLRVVAEIYEATLVAKKQGKNLKPKLKNILEDQRSALDHLAHAIHARDGTPSKSRTYYPSAERPSEFNGHIDQNMPGVRAARPDIATAIERHQRYQPDHDWVKWLYELVNENKHRTLSPLKPRDTSSPAG